MSRRLSPNTDPPHARGGGSGGCARSIARARVRSQSRVVALRHCRSHHCRSHAHGPEKERRGIIKTHKRKPLTLRVRACGTSTRTNKKQKNAVISVVRKMASEPTPFLASSACWFPPKFPPNTQHRDERIPRTQVTYAAFPSRGVLGDNSTVKTQPKWRKTEPLLKGQLLPRQNRIPLTQIHHSFS